MAKIKPSSLPVNFRHHPKLVGLLSVGLLLIWAAWQLADRLVDPAISESDIVSRRISVDRGRYDQLVKDLVAYHQPAAAPDLTVNLFRLPPGSDATD